MTTPDRTREDRVPEDIRARLEAARPDQIRSLLWDVMTSHLARTDQTDRIQ